MSSLYCDVCQVELNGPTTAGQHYKSAKHQKKVDASRLASTGRPYCDACRIFCDTMQILAQHKQSPKHLAMEQKCEGDAAPNAVRLSTIPAFAGLGRTQEQPAGEATMPQGPVGMSSTRAGSAEPEYTFTLNRGVCNVCKLDLTSAPHAKQHLSGKNHAKLKERWQRERISRGFADQPQAVNNGPAAVNLVSTLSSGSSLRTQAGAITLPTPLPLPNSSTTPKPSSDKSYEFNVESEQGQCYACAVKFRSFKEMKEHLKGDEHKENDSKWHETKGKNKDTESVVFDRCQSSLETLARQRDQEIKRALSSSSPRLMSPQGVPTMRTSLADGTSWYMCETCNKPLNTLHQLRTHQESPKHIKKQQQLDHFRSQGVAQNSPMPGDRTVWHECDICQKKLNSAEQLEAHRASHRGVSQELELLQNIQKKEITDGETTWNYTCTICQVGFTSSDQLEMHEASHPSSATAIAQLSGNSSVAPAPSPDRADDGGKFSETNLVEALDMLSLEGRHARGGSISPSHHDANNTLNSSSRWIDEGALLGDNPFGPNFPYYCAVCKVPFNTKKVEEAHMGGRSHLAAIAKAESVPARQLPPVSKSCSMMEMDKSDLDLTKTIPRSYQVELYHKAMIEDTICFLPTGTGKTLVAVMVISKMLQLNPQRPVVFLVDKVLLVLQQCGVLQAEIGDKLYDRYDVETSSVARRVPRIAALCSGKQDSGGLPLWQQDVIVATAAYYNNLLQKGLVRWEDHSLVVLDEAHHCDKDHPYHCLMQDFHHKLPTESRPKVMGLTASPAGKDSLAATVTMMRKLLRNMGQVSLIKVQEHEEELARYRSNTELVIRNISRSVEEEDMKHELQIYILKCHLELVGVTNIRDLLCNEGILLEGLGPGNVTRFLRTVDSDEVGVLLAVLDRVAIIRSADHAATRLLLSHVELVCRAFLTLCELGLDCARQELFAVAGGSMAEIQNLGLPVRELQVNIRQLQRCDNPSGVQDLDANMIPIVCHIVKEMKWIDWDAPRNQFGHRPIVLILVKERKHAHTVADLLQRCRALVNLDINTVCVVGHGTTADKGMTVKKQETAIEQIKKHVYQVIVATSVAEEGLDLPECELVVQLDPPNSVKALVQIRGRARKKGSRFVAICREADQVESLNSLIQQEEFLTDAIDKIIKGSATYGDSF